MCAHKTEVSFWQEKMNFDNYSCDNQMSIFDFTREPISITKPIRLIELFAGYGSQAMALKRIGAKFEHHRVVEFDKYAIASYNAVHGTSNCLTSVQKDNLLLENNIQKVGQISSNGSQCGTVISDNGISANLVAGTHGYANSHIATQYRIRKLTPRECGRLMGVSDEDIDKMAAVNSNTQLYKQFGNSIVVDVMCAMFKNLNIKQGDNNETLQTN